MPAHSANVLYQMMCSPAFFEASLELFASDIKSLVEGGQETWDNLGFTEADVDERLRQGRVRIARQAFQDMENSDYTAYSVTLFAARIFRIVTTGHTTWDELGFTESDVNQRLEQVKARSATTRI